MLSLTATILIVCTGLVIVVGGILGFRLHAFLALILAALAVSLLTPATTVEWYDLGKRQITVLETGESTIKVNINAPKNETREDPIGEKLQLVSREESTGELVSVGSATISEFDNGKAVDEYETYTEGDIDWEETIVVTSQARHNARSFANKSVGEIVAEGFGNTCTGIGILIALAAIIGKCLLDSGAAEKVVRWMLRLVGEKNAPASFVFSSFTLSTPVFFDTVFYLMIPLGKALRLRTGKNYVLYILAIVVGAAVAHSLVPPTPGPLLVAETLHVDIGLMILVGGIVGLLTSLVGFIYALMVSKLIDIPLRESADVSLEELEEIAGREDSELPSIWMSLMPIILPVILISGGTIVDTVMGGTPRAEMSTAMQYVDHFFDLFGNKNIAMAISATVAIVILVQQTRTSFEHLADSLQAALASGGVIILITAAGGAFGKSLQQTGVADHFGDVSGASAPMILGIAFTITALVRVAQGSATVSMITGVGVMGGFAAGVELPFHPVYIALAIGFGSMVLMWMNDSGFWIISKMSGMTEWETLKLVTPLMTVMGVAGLIFTIIGATILPLV